MTYVVSFLPWIAYGVLSGTVGWTPALVAALLIAVAVTVFKRATGKAVDVLTAGGIVFFVALLVASPWLEGTAATHWTQTASHGWMALLMWGSIAARSPFTLVFSREEAPVEVVGTPEFVRFNDIISGMWAVSFTVATGVLVALTLAGVDSVAVAGGVVTASIVVPVVAMQRFVARVTADEPAPVAA